MYQKPVNAIFVQEEDETNEMVTLNLKVRERKFHNTLLRRNSAYKGVSSS